MDQEKFRDQIVSRVRSCLISTKGKISLRQLEDDYHTLLGERIPYNKLGFRTLGDFIQSVPSLILIKSSDGFLVDARPSEQSSHISSMVSRQKAITKKKSFKPSYKSNNQCVPVMTNWRPKNAAWNNKKQYQGSPRLAAVSHNQFVNRPKPSNDNHYVKPSVSSKVVVVSKPQQPPQITKKPERLVPISPPLTPPNQEKEKVLSTPLSSARKRIAKGMREIDLDRDSGNSSPTYEFPQANPIREFVPTGDPVKDLKNFVVYFKLGELEIKYTRTKPKSSKMPVVYCTIKVDSQVYSSYPKDLLDERSAEKVAAQNALDGLIPKHNRRRSLLISGNEDIIERIPPMLEKHQNAVWMSQIESDYIFKYNEQLPANWLQVVDRSSFVSIEKCMGGYVLKYCKPGDKGKRINVNLHAFDVSVPSNTVQFAENNRLFAIITCVTSINEIWCQQCYTPEYDSFIEMSNAMDRFYNKNGDGSVVCKNVNYGSCYAIYHSETGWVRVRAISSFNKDQVNCFMIDFGEECCVESKNVFYLKQEFAVNQAQAFVCRLEGLEELHATSTDSVHLQNLMGKEVVLEMGSDEGSENMDITIPVVMYDTVTGDSINKELISLLTMESASPVLDKTAITEVYVSNIEDNGDVYVQVRNKAFHVLIKMLEELEKNLTAKPPSPPPSPPIKQNSDNRFYLMKYWKLNKWMRVSILDWSPKGDLAQIYFVDYGNTNIIKVNEVILYPLDNLDDVISQYPAQAVKVRILLEALPADIVAKASKLMPEDQAILLKIVSFDSEGVPHVEFFKRSNDGVLVCINKSITMEDELKNLDTANNNDTTNRSSRLMNLVKFNESSIKNVPSGGCLKRPVLPDKNLYFGVCIPFAVNPWNFFIQPIESLNDLTRLMEDMQMQYRDMVISPLLIDDIVPGKIYASKHEDGRWYRTSVLKVIHSGSISVFYCDYGYYTNLSLHQLVPLDLKYMNLPYQAMKAKLTGIKPIKNKWSMDDCETFKNLVTKKQFFSILIDIEKDELYRSDSILQLILIDTSTKEDVHIRDELVKKGIAAYVN